jgi:hypothetical protein
LPPPPPPKVLCPSTAPVAKKCPNPRPNEKTCPTRYYLIAPTPNFCGITATGERLDFPEECDACKDKNVVEYFNKPCKSAPKYCKDN